MGKPITGGRPAGQAATCHASLLPPLSGEYDNMECPPWLLAQAGQCERSSRPWMLSASFHNIEIRSQLQATPRLNSALAAHE
jgi:hypothetical protein